MCVRGLARKDHPTGYVPFVPELVGQKPVPIVRSSSLPQRRSQRVSAHRYHQKSTCALILAYRAGTMPVGSSHAPPGTNPWL